MNFTRTRIARALVFGAVGLTAACGGNAMAATPPNEDEYAQWWANAQDEDMRIATCSEIRDYGVEFTMFEDGVISVANSWDHDEIYNYGLWIEREGCATLTTTLPAAPPVGAGPVDQSLSAAEGYALLNGYESPSGHVTFDNVECPDYPTFDRVSALFECQATDILGDSWTVLVTILTDGSGSYIGNAWINLPEPEPVVDTLPDDPELADFVAHANVAGYVGPIAMPDGTQTALITRSDVAAMSGGVELAVERPDGWGVEQTHPIDGFIPDSPEEIGDLTGDGRSEIRVPLIASTGGKGWDLLFRIDTEGPRLYEIPFDTDALAAIGVDAISLRIDSVATNRVTTSIGSCTPTCAEDVGTSVEWYLDQTSDWILRPAVDNAGSGQPVCPTPDTIASALTTAYGNKSYYYGVQYSDIRCYGGWASAGVINAVDGGFVVLQLVGDQWVAHDLGTGGECSDIPVPSDIAPQIC